MSGLTIPVNGKPVRHEYDENDPAQVAEMRAKFEAIAGKAGMLKYSTTPQDGTTTIHQGEYPEGQAEVIVSSQYAGG